MLLVISLFLLNGLFGQHYAVSQETPQRDTLLYYWHDPIPDKYPNLVPEDCYMELYLEDGIVKKGFFWGTTDEFDMGREGYECGYFILPMTEIQHEGDSILFKLSLIRTERGKIVDYCFVKEPIDRHIRFWQEALSRYQKWDCIRGSMYYNDVQFSISSGQKATNTASNHFPMGDSISVCNLTNDSWTRTFVLVNAQSDTVAE